MATIPRPSRAEGGVLSRSVQASRRTRNETSSRFAATIAPETIAPIRTMKNGKASINSISATPRRRRAFARVMFGAP